jgi:hypothetical protein
MEVTCEAKDLLPFMEMEAGITIDDDRSKPIS